MRHVRSRRVRLRGERRVGGTCRASAGVAERGASPCLARAGAAGAVAPVRPAAGHTKKTPRAANTHYIIISLDKGLKSQLLSTGARIIKLSFLHLILGIWRPAGAELSQTLGFTHKGKY